MREFSIGQHFSGIYPPEAALWCNANNAMIIKDGEGYTITEVSEPEDQEYNVEEGDDS